MATINRALSHPSVVLVFGILLGIALAGVLLLSLQSFESTEVHRFGARRRTLEEVGTGLTASLISGGAIATGNPWANDTEAKMLRLGLVKPEVVSWSPRIIVYHHFLSDEECDKMMDLGRPKLETSTVVDVSTGKGVHSSVRTSSGMFLSMGDRNLPFVMDIENRIAAYSMVPFANGELIQILRYELNQEYKPHHDFFVDQFNLKRGGQRVATMLMYIMEPEEGGHTIFPNVRGKMCQCGTLLRPGLCVPSKKGTAVLFWSTRLDGSTDPDSLHGSCPVLKGEKWSATKWMRQSVFT